MKSPLTLTAWICDLSKWVVACVALATNDARPALALAGLCVTWPREGSHRVAVARETGVGARRMVVKLLQTCKGHIRPFQQLHKYMRNNQLKLHENIQNTVFITFWRYWCSLVCFSYRPFSLCRILEFHEIVKKNPAHLYVSGALRA